MAEAGPVVVDTMVFSWSLAATPVGHLYAPHLQGRPLILAVQTVAELRALALINGWGDARRAALDERIARLRVAGVDEELANTYARLKADCRQQGHALGDKLHDGDRWIAATAVRYDIPLVSHDGIFRNTPGLDLVTELEDA
jgi:predicted nucleic acid-binding protein